MALAERSTPPINTTLTAIGCRFENNQALGDSADGGGGAIQIITDSQATITDCVFNNNSTPFDGGGINIYGCDVVVTGCSFDGNSGGDGGGVSVIGSDDTILEDCRFSTNFASENGGAITILNSDSTYRRCSFIGNSAGHGGAVNIDVGLDESPHIINALFVGNTAQFGGAVSNAYRVRPDLTNCTFWSNTATEPSPSGGAIYNEDQASPIVTNCILWNDGPDEIYNLDDTCDPVVSYCIVEGSYSGGSHIIDRDPLFLDPAHGDFHLAFNSHAVDSGDNAALPAEITTDFEGDDRFVDGDGNGSVLIDFGALEFDSTEMGSFNGDFDVDLRDFGLFAETWMKDLGMPGFNPACDMFPADGKINLYDLNAWAQFWLQGR